MVSICLWVMLYPSNTWGGAYSPWVLLREFMLLNSLEITAWFYFCPVLVWQSLNRSCGEVWYPKQAGQHWEGETLHRDGLSLFPGKEKLPLEEERSCILSHLTCPCKVHKAFPMFWKTGLLLTASQRQSIWPFLLQVLSGLDASCCEVNRSSPPSR